MTEIVLETSESEVEVKPVVVKFITALLMILAVVCSASLFSFVMQTKLAKQSFQMSSVTAESRERQLACLAKNIYHEAGNQPFEGKVAVAQVTLNRVSSGQFPNDICQTVYQKNKIMEKVVCQFSWVCDHVVLTKKIQNNMYDESMVVAKKVLLEGFRLPSLEDAMYFHGDYINPGWRREKVAKIGNHIFYK